MMDVTLALEVHESALQETGGASGVRDIGALESALARPYGGFDGEEFYPSPEEKAAAILESILLNHPFVDGNKRTGYILARLVLNAYYLDMQVPKTARYDFVISVASGDLSFAEIVDWIRKAVAKF